MKKRLLLSIVTMTLFLVPSGAVHAEEEAKSLEVKCEFSSGAHGDKLFDNDMDTVVKVKEGTTLHITAEENIQGIYIKWNYIPNKGVKLSYNTVSMDTASNGYVHEYISLDEKTKEIDFTFEENASIAEIQVFSEGELPDSVQVWNTMEGEADILVLPAFAFHEALFFGGPIANYAALDYKVQVMFMCGYDDAGSISRIHEMLDCLWDMGVVWYPTSAHQIELYSNDMEQVKQQYDADAVTDLIKEGIQKYEPYVVVGQDLEGEDGNSVHRLWAECLKNAIAELEDENGYMPQKVYFHNYKENQIIIDISKNINQIVQAYKNHRTQAFRGVWPSDEVKSPLNCVIFGLYNTKVGFDTSNDLMEHVKEREKKEPESELEQEQVESVGQISVIDDVKENKLNMLGIIGLVLIGIGVVILVAAGVYTVAWRTQNKKKNIIK